MPTGKRIGLIMPTPPSHKQGKSLLEKILISKCIYRIISATDLFQQGGTIT